MKNFAFVFLCLIFTSFGYSQTKYENGYIIKKNDEKVNCLIKNLNWKNNPTEVYYKLTEISPEEIGTLETIKEFGVTDKLKFENHLVDIDKSRNQSNILTSFKEPRFNKERLFLRVLVAGKSTLYRYSESNLKRYFYNVDGSEVEQLVYKKYLLNKNSNSTVGENKQYIKQLFDNLKCESTKYTDIQKVDYTRNSLENYFVKYNACNNSSSIIEKKGKLAWNISAKTGISFNSLTIENALNDGSTLKFDKETSVKFGFEIEAVLPFNNNKWALFLDPAYQSYQSEKESSIRFSSVFTRTYDNMIDYKYVEVPFGVRHYFYLGEGSKLFLDAAIVFNLDLKSDLIINKTDTDEDNLDTEPKSNFAFGIGYKFNDKYSVQAKFYSAAQIEAYESLNSKYNSISLTVGYTIF